MSSLIKGISVILHQKVQSGTDAMNAPIYREDPITIDNVIVSPSAAEDIVSDMQHFGKRAEYELCIPKGDTHNWEDATVEFFGKKWKTFGFPKEYIEALVPMDWNRKIKVERYG